jgi:hypothetical protein
MNKGLPEISYERNLNHNYMILRSCDYFGMSQEHQNDFRKRMILENNIEGLLPVKQRNINGELCYYYEINSLQSIDRLYAKKEIGYDELKQLLMGCVRLFERLEEYLLDGSQIILKPEFVYMNIDTCRLYFVCYPEYEGDVREEFREFVDMLLTKIDHMDNDAVMLSYKVYRYTKNINYVISEVSHIIEDTIIPQTLQQDFGYGGNGLDNANSSNDDEMYNHVMYNNMTYNHTEKKDKAKKDRTKKDKKSKKISTEKAKEKKSGDSSGGKINGKIVCLAIAAVTIGIIAAAKVTGMDDIIADVELYLYGVMAMSLVGAVIFAVRDGKKEKLAKEKAALSAPCEDDYGVNNRIVPNNIVHNNIVANNNARKNIVLNNIIPNNNVPNRIEPNNGVVNNIVPNDIASNNNVYNNTANNNIVPNIIYRHNTPIKEKTQGTTCLNGNTVEERLLIGRVNGKEVTIPLTNFPATLGKQAGISDIILDDNAVSKMHARFEEHEGRIYILDLNSTNGTIRNGTMLDINSPVVLEVGDRLRFGRSCFTYC